MRAWEVEHGRMSNKGTCSSSAVPTTEVGCSWCTSYLPPNPLPFVAFFPIHHWSSCAESLGTVFLHSITLRYAALNTALPYKQDESFISSLNAHASTMSPSWYNPKIEPFQTRKAGRYHARPIHQSTQSFFIPFFHVLVLFMPEYFFSAPNNCASCPRVYS